MSKINDTSGDPLLPLKEAFVRKLNEVVDEFRRIDDWKAKVSRQLDEGNARQDELQQIAKGLYETANTFGFDLSVEQALANRVSAQSPTAPIPAPAEPEVIEPNRTQPIREIILEWARMAFPQPVRAAQLRRRLKERFSLEVHEKTVGMTLYRLSQRGSMKRQGFDWYYVPESERGFSAENEQDPEASNGL